LFLFCWSLTCSQFLVEFFDWRSVNSSLAAGNYSVHNFYVEVLNFLSLRADLVCPALNTVFLVSTGLGTAGLGLGLGTVGLGLGLGRPGLDNITGRKCVKVFEFKCGARQFVMSRRLLQDPRRPAGWKTLL
jgi:hypothetical protein